MKAEWKACGLPDQIALGVAAKAAGVGGLAGSNWGTPPIPVDVATGVAKGVPVLAALPPFAALCSRRCLWVALRRRCAPRSWLRPQLEVSAVALWPWPYYVLGGLGSFVVGCSLQDHVGSTRVRRPLVFPVFHRHFRNMDIGLLRVLSELAAMYVKKILFLFSKTYFT